MRITIVQGAFFPIPPLLGGAVEKRWYGLGREFAKMGHDVTHISRSYLDLPDRQTEDGVHYIRVRGENSTNKRILLKIRDFLYTKRVLSHLPEADILLSNTFWLPVTARDSSRGKIVVCVGRMPKGQMRFYPRKSIFHANSRAVKDAILSEIPSAKDRIITIQNPLPFEPPAEVNFRSKESVILYAGRIHPEKGLDLLIDAARTLPEGWILDVVGPHEISAGGGGEAYLSSLKRKAKGLPVMFTGPLYGINDLAERYRRSKIFVYPSIAEGGETFGLAVLEAMAWGCIPIVSDLNCFKDFVHHGTNGMVFNHRGPEPFRNLSSLILELSGNRILAEQLSTRALEVRLTHSLGAVARLFIKEFDLIAESNRKKHL